MELGRRRVQPRFWTWINRLPLAFNNLSPSSLLEGQSEPFDQQNWSTAAVSMMLLT